MRDQTATRRAVDLSHEIVDGMITHPGIPAPTISTRRPIDSAGGLTWPGWPSSASPAYLADNPFLTEAAVRRLVEEDAALIGGMAGGSSQFRPGFGAWQRSRSGPSRSWADAQRGFGRLRVKGHRRYFRPGTMAMIDAVVDHEEVSPALLTAS